MVLNDVEEISRSHLEETGMKILVTKAGLGHGNC
jgi:hypothetical protein